MFKGFNGFWVLRGGVRLICGRHTLMSACVWTCPPQFCVPFLGKAPHSEEAACRYLAMALWPQQQGPPHLSALCFHLWLKKSHLMLIQDRKVEAYWLKGRSLV